MLKEIVRYAAAAALAVSLAACTATQEQATLSAGAAAAPIVCAAVGANTSAKTGSKCSGLATVGVALGSIAVSASAGPAAAAN
jgi:hypothetical protein